MDHQTNVMLFGKIAANRDRLKDKRKKKENKRFSQFHFKWHLNTVEVCSQRLLNMYLGKYFAAATAAIAYVVVVILLLLPSFTNGKMCYFFTIDLSFIPVNTWLIGVRMSERKPFLYYTNVTFKAC